jgi:Na+/alanine symporter
MWVSAFCAMMMKYAEILLAIRHRRFDDEEKPHGSAMEYMTDHMSRMRHKQP